MHALPICASREETSSRAAGVLTGTLPPTQNQKKAYEHAAG